MEKIKDFYKKNNNILYNCAVVVLILFILFLHLYRLGEVPRGMEVDEIGMAYDAWCIGHYGVSRYLTSLPLYLNNYGGGQSVLYCYLAVPFVMIGGFNAALARIPSVIFSMITCIVGFALIKKTRGKLTAIIYLFVFATIPYFTQSGRIALDCNLMLGCVVIILYILEYCLRQGREAKWCYFLLGVVIGVSMYSYALSNMIFPLFFIALYPFLRLCGKKITGIQALLVFLPALVIAFPLVLFQVVNIWKLPDIMIGPFTVAKIDFYRLTEISFDEIRPNITWIFRSLFTADNQEFDSFPQFGALYIISLPVIIVGFVITLVRTAKSIKAGEFIFDGVIMVFSIVMMGLALILLGVTTYRINALFFCLTFYIAVTIEACFTRKNYRRIFAAAGVLLMLSYTVYSGFFLDYYFNKYEDEYYPQRLFAENPREVYEFLDLQSDEIKDRLTYVGGVNEAYAYYLLSMEVSPYEYNVRTLGNNGDGEKFLFYAPEPYTKDANYVFYLPDQEIDEKLLGMGFKAIDKGPYRIYLNMEQ